MRTQKQTRWFQLSTPLQHYPWVQTHCLSAILARGHARIRNLRTGFSTPMAALPRALRRTTAWSILAQAI